MLNFKQYYRQAILRNKTNLDEMIRPVWAIWQHKVNEISRILLKNKKYFIIDFVERRAIS